MKKFVIASVFILTIILSSFVSAKTVKSSSASFTKSSQQIETITFVDSIKPITEKQRKKAIRKAKSIQKQMDRQIRRGRVVPVRREVVLPRRDDGVPLELDIEFVGNVTEEAQEAAIRAFEVATERILLDEDNGHRDIGIRLIASAGSLGNGILATAEVVTRDIDGASYPSALAEYLQDEDLRDGFDVYITYSWLHPPVPWYYGLAEDCEENNQVHFGSVMAHELGHGLGFHSRIIVENEYGRFLGNVPSFYDLCLVDEDNNSIIENYAEGGELVEILTNDNIFWQDDQEDNIRIYAPQEWYQGSSISHVHTDYYGGVNELMTPFIRTGDSFSWEAGSFFWRVLAGNGNGWPLSEEEGNEPPEWTELLERVEGREGQRIDFNFSAIDHEEDNLEFSFESENLPEGWEIEYNEDELSGTFIWDTGFNDEGEYILSAIVSDGENEVNREIQIIVTNVNRQPIIREEIEDIAVDEDAGEQEVVDLDDIFMDPDGDELVLDFLGEEVLNLNLNDETNILTISPDHNFYTEELLEVLVSASDEEEEAVASFMVTVNSVNDNPQWLELPEEAVTVTEGDIVEFTLTAQDEADNNTDLTIVIRDSGGLPGEVQDFLENDGQGTANFRWQTGVNQWGEYNPTFQVIDNENGVSEEITATIMVRRWIVPLVRPSW